MEIDRWNNISPKISKKIFERWNKLDLFKIIDKDGNEVDMSEEEGTPLALQFEETLNILKGLETDKDYVDVFALLKRMYLKKKEVLVPEFVDKYIRFRNCQKYKELYSDMKPFDPEWELNSLFYELYDEIENIIDGSTNISYKDY